MLADEVIVRAAGWACLTHLHQSPGVEVRLHKCAAGVGHALSGQGSIQRMSRRVDDGSGRYSGYSKELRPMPMSVVHVDRRLIGEVVPHVAETANRIEALLGIMDDDAARLLTPVLERMQAESGEVGGGTHADDAENAAFLAQLVTVVGVERRRKPFCPRRPVLRIGASSTAHIGMGERGVTVGKMHS